MTRFKAVYKSEYNKVIEESNEFEQTEIKVYDSNKKNDSLNFYNFDSKMCFRSNSAQLVYSSRTKNKNERFENELLCTK